MKTVIWSFVLLALCIMPSLSQEYYDVRDAEMAVSEDYTHEYYARKDPVFANEATSSIAVKQMVESRVNRINYRIFIKNTGEAKLTNISLLVTPPTKVTHLASFYFRNPTQGRVPISALMSNRDGTTKSLTLNPRDLNTGELIGILVTFDRNTGSDQANDKKNAVEVRATVLNPSERELFENALKDMAMIEIVAAGPIVIGDVSTYNIQIRNKGKTRLAGIVLDATLPKKVQYKDSRYDKSQDSNPLPRPTQIESNGTTYLSWFLGDLDTGSSKSIDLNVTCDLDECPNVSDYNLEASGWTLVVHKIPMKVTSNFDLQGGGEQGADSKKVEEPTKSPEVVENVTILAEPEI